MKAIRRINLGRGHASSAADRCGIVRAGPLKLPLGVLPYGISALIHGAIFTTLLYVEWLPGPISKPQIILAKGEQANEVSVSIINWVEIEEQYNPKQPRLLNEPTTDDGPSTIDLLAQQAMIAQSDNPNVDKTEQDRELPSLTVAAQSSTPSTCSKDDKIMPQEEIIELRPSLEPDEVVGAVTEALRKLYQDAVNAFSQEPPVPAQLEPIQQPQSSTPTPTEDHHQSQLYQPIETRVIEVAQQAQTSQPVQPVVTNPPEEFVIQSPKAKSKQESASPTKQGVETGVEIVDVPKPKYPLLSRRQGEEGLVLLEVEVLADGTVGKINVLRHPGFPRLVEAATEAIRKARFNPATRKGEAVRAVVRIPLRFILL